MTLTAPAPQQADTTQTGQIVQIIGPVVDVQFPPEHLPEIYNALALDLSNVVSVSEEGTNKEEA